MVPDGEEEAARQMYIAYLCFTYPPEISLMYKDAKEQALTISDKITPEERKQFFVDQLLKGDIENRRFIDSEGAEFLFGLFMEPEKYSEYYADEVEPGKVSLLAGKALTSYALPSMTITCYASYTFR
jgi:hypothetical protein